MKLGTAKKQLLTCNFSGGNNCLYHYGCLFMAFRDSQSVSARGLLDFTLIHYRPLFHGFYFNIDGQQGKFFATFRAFSIISLKNFVRRLKLRAFI